MNYVSFETSKRLKAAGFPQPDFETGQVWYNPKGTPVFIGPVAKASEWSFRSMSIHTGVAADIYPDSIDACYFAPTATDLLKELGRAYVLGFEDELFLLYRGVVDKMVNLGENAAEVCASEWIERSPDSTFSKTIKWIE